MRYLRIAFTTCVLALLASAALAQQGPGPGPGMPGYGYGHMWGGGWGWHGGHLLVMLLAFIGIIALIVSLTRWFTHASFHGHGCLWCPHRHRGHESEAMTILEERFAKGEIDKTEFEDKRKLLRR